MRVLILALPFALSPLALPAQDAPAPSTELDQGMSLLQQGAELFLRGLMTEVEPKMQEMQKGLDDLGATMGSALDQAQPWITALSSMVDDFGYYDPPERLPNGDIVIRRKADAPPVQLEDLPPAPQTDL
jgi:hypothetical protein